MGFKSQRRCGIKCGNDLSFSEEMYWKTPCEDMDVVIPLGVMQQGPLWLTLGAEHGGFSCCSGWPKPCSWKIGHELHNGNMGTIPPCYCWESTFSFLFLTLDSHCFFKKYFFFFFFSQKQTMQEAPDSLFLVKDQLLSRIAPSKPSCLGKLQSKLLDRPRLPRLWAPPPPHL